VTLNIRRTEYKGVYIQKPGTIVDGPSSFTTESEEGWNDVRNVGVSTAKSTANLRRYSANFAVDQYLKLTPAQLDSIAKPRPPAGDFYKPESSLGKLADW